MSRQRGRPCEVNYVCLLKRIREFRNLSAWGNKPVSLMFLDVCRQNPSRCSASFLNDQHTATKELVEDCRWMNNSPCPKGSWTCIRQSLTCGLPKGSRVTRSGPLWCSLTCTPPQTWMNRLQQLWLFGLVAKYIPSHTFNFLLLVTNRVQLEERLI